MKIPRKAYMTAKYLISDYGRLRLEKKSPVLCMIVEKSLEAIPTEYRKGVMDKLCYGKGFPLDASKDTYYEYCTKLVRQVAYNLNLI